MSLAAQIGAMAQAHPNRAALTIEGESVTHGELDVRVAATAGYLAARFQPGDRVMVALPNSLAMVTAYLSVVRAGLTAVLVNPALAEPELRAIANRSGARATFGSADRTGLESIVEHPDHAPAAPALVDNDAPIILAFTSGTTGKPKGVPLSSPNMLASARGIIEAWDWTPDDVLVHALPLSHQHGITGLHAVLLTGSRGVFAAAFDPDRLVAAVDSEHATVLFAVPAMWHRLVETDLSPLRQLRLAVSGSAPLAPSLADRISELIGQTPLERYGLTESGMNVSNPVHGDRRPGTVGRPLPGIEVRLADSAGNDVVEGEILLRGSQVFNGYWQDAAATNASFHPGGWFRTGDLGRFDDGYLVITGRLKELIISGGYNVYPREVESVLEECPGVRQAAIAGIPSERWGEQVTAWIVGDADPDAVIRHARERLAHYKCPKQVFGVDSLPRNALGKLMRASLTAPVETELGEASGTRRSATALGERSEVAL